MLIFICGSNNKKLDKQYKLDFTHPLQSWPSQGCFPLNLKNENRTVLDVVLNDLKNSDEYLIITGFTSLANVIETFGSEKFKDLKRVRILIGFEPEVRKRKKWKKVHIRDEIRDYWLERNIDVFLGGAIIKTIELIKSNHLDFRVLDHLHAKIYVGSTHAILGSANFSINGLTAQKEGNFRSPNPEATYEGMKLIAENFWENGSDYNERMISLLEELLQKVPWQYALARSIAEIIEENWLSDYPILKRKFDEANLWPFQKAGVAKALHLLEHQGSVLIADPTGSGKTRTVTMCIIALIHRLWESGRKDFTNTLVLCPKAIIDNWQKESREISFLNNSQLSMGILQVVGRNRNKAIKDLHITNILVMDEAHNFLSKKTNRSKALYEHSANHVILSTATPINKKAEDLLRLIELLDPDNLNDEELQILKELYENRIRDTKPEDLRKLNGFIQKFILRRTKKEINEKIKKNADAYKDKNGNPAKYPSVKNQVYSTNESKTDLEIARKIHSISENDLLGLIYLRKFKLPPFVDKNDGEKIESYVKGRLRAAKVFAAYQIRNAMRSSRVALVEHISGTKAAKDWLNIKGSKPDTGDTIGKLNSFITKELPYCDFDSTYLPSWLVNKKDYKDKVQAEISHYESILKLIKAMSGSRENGKVDKILMLREKYKMVLAFDSTILTLFYFRQLIYEKGIKDNLYLVSGSNSTSREIVQEVFGIDSETESAVALCSDTMAEGVNLQKAKALVQFDIPSVLRLAEQRVGRLHRLDSPHKKVQVYWPDDPEEFALKSDRRLVTTAMLTDQLIGGNLELPESFINREFKIIRARELIKIFKPTFENESEKWEGLHDAFQAVYDLKEGENPLITEEVYEALKGSKAKIRCSVSFVSSDVDWAFICTKGTEKNSPSWLFIDGSGKLHTEFPIISELLRIKLTSIQDTEWEQEALEKFIKIYQLNERNSLSNKKRRVLEVAEFLLERQQKIEDDQDVQTLIRELQKAFDTSFDEDDMRVDFNRFSDLWLELLKPLLKERQKKQRRRVLITLDDLKVQRNKKYFSKSELQKIYENIPLTEKLGVRIAACIVGVGIKESFEK